MALLNQKWLLAREKHGSCGQDASVTPWFAKLQERFGSEKCNCAAQALEALSAWANAIRAVMTAWFKGTWPLASKLIDDRHSRITQNHVRAQVVLRVMTDVNPVLWTQSARKSANIASLRKNCSGLEPFVRTRRAVMKWWSVAEGVRTTRRWQGRDSFICPVARKSVAQCSVFRHIERMLHGRWWLAAEGSWCPGVASGDASKGERGGTSAPMAHGGNNSRSKGETARAWQLCSAFSFSTWLTLYSLMMASDGVLGRAQAFYEHFIWSEAEYNVVSLSQMPLPVLQASLWNHCGWCSQRTVWAQQSSGSTTGDWEERNHPKKNSAPKVSQLSVEKIWKKVSTRNLTKSVLL